jgi:hypothetical protein
LTSFTAKLLTKLKKRSLTPLIFLVIWLYSPLFRRKGETGKHKPLEKKGFLNPY